MANKHQVLALVEKGFNNQEIAKKLKCKDAYVRAVKARAFGNGLAVDAKYQARVKDYKLAKARERYRTDAVFRKRQIEATLRSYYRRKAQNQTSA